MDVENIKKLRTPTRSNFTRALNKASEFLETKLKDTDVLPAQIVLLEQKHKNLKDLDSKMLSNLQRDATGTQKSFDEEYEAITAYEVRFSEIKTILYTTF
ncbi:uncharacterized protein NPIL_322431 [Nephila pilipes]|uniref:Uncharacterized protein n=1 Tax=Nephila pilipes TaxID=299642 RepID=A0A8X6QFC1_NEPPI|nr:uncharacterized protein NPIL_322431 [Nephila pilipes]